MRQAGILAAAGLYALQNNVERLAQDHENAKTLALGLAQIKELEINPDTVQTNMVFAQLKGPNYLEIARQLQEKGVLIFPEKKLRLVTHLDISAEDIQTTIQAFEQVFGNRR